MEATPARGTRRGRGRRAWPAARRLAETQDGAWPRAGEQRVVLDVFFRAQQLYSRTLRAEEVALMRDRVPALHFTFRFGVALLHVPRLVTETTQIETLLAGVLRRAPLEVAAPRRLATGALLLRAQPVVLPPLSPGFWFAVADEFARARRVSERLPQLLAALEPHLRSLALLPATPAEPAAPARAALAAETGAGAALFDALFWACAARGRAGLAPQLGAALRLRTREHRRLVREGADECNVFDLWPWLAARTPASPAEEMGLAQFGLVQSEDPAELAATALRALAAPGDEAGGGGAVGDDWPELHLQLLAERGSVRELLELTLGVARLPSAAASVPRWLETLRAQRAGDPEAWPELLTNLAHLHLAAAIDASALLADERDAVLAAPVLRDTAVLALFPSLAPERRRDAPWLLPIYAAPGCLPRLLARDCAALVLPLVHDGTLRPDADWAPLLWRHGAWRLLRALLLADRLPAPAPAPAPAPVPAPDADAGADAGAGGDAGEEEPLGDAGEEDPLGDAGEEDPLGEARAVLAAEAAVLRGCARPAGLGSARAARVLASGGALVEDELCDVFGTAPGSGRAYALGLGL